MPHCWHCTYPVGHAIVCPRYHYEDREEGMDLAEIKEWMVATGGKGGIARRDHTEWLISEVERLMRYSDSLRGADAWKYGEINRLEDIVKNLKAEVERMTGSNVLWTAQNEANADENKRLRDTNRSQFEEIERLTNALKRIANWYDGESDFSGDTPTSYAAEALRG